MIIVIGIVLSLAGCKTQNKGNYIVNKNNGKLHYYTCDNLPYEKNRIYFESEEAANAVGYTNRHVECMPTR